MNKSIISSLVITVLLSFTSCTNQIKNVKTENIKTESVKVFGNCEMCESTIEKAGNDEKVAQVDWNKETKIAILNYDSTKTNQDEILKRIALAGYDNELFRAPDDIYSSLPGCCQYERPLENNIGENTQIETPMDTKDHPMHSDTVTEMQASYPLSSVFENYFLLKDALVKSDGNLASAKAKELLISLNAIQMDQLSNEEHLVWMKVMKDLKLDTEHIEETNDVGHQRDHFNSLSDNVYQLLKVSKQEMPIYYQYCPMANDGKGANWLSQEEEVKNPYYGSMMLNCGEVIETIE